MALRVTTRLRCKFGGEPTTTQYTKIHGFQRTWEHEEHPLWKGPQTRPEEVPSVGYLGNIKTPNWMLGATDEEGDQIFHKAKEIFKPYKPSNKKAVANFKMRIAPGKAAAGPPVGTSFAQFGIKSMEFIKVFNDLTSNVFLPDPTLLLKVYIRIYEDKSYQFRILPPPTGWLLARVSMLPFAGKKKRGVKGWKETYAEGFAGYLTLQQVYHVAAIANSWQHHPDWAPLEFRVANLLTSAKTQGLCVLGVHSQPPPVLGFTDNQFREHITKKASEWETKRKRELNINPLDKLPWHIKMPYMNTEGFEFRGKSEKKAVIKDAIAIDKSFQDLLSKENPRPDAGGSINWDHWRQTRSVEKIKAEPHSIEAKHIRENIDTHIDYILKRSPGTLSRSGNYRALWHDEDWTSALPETSLTSRIR
eukprot:TRINITY_DN10630_c0_g2_i1.p1 TRINITY_DN10630_c0_g2~~TRINITY_DN10630_c0_g2_i1.p1  ORF type:complete len:418 (+),score=34.64 TRINITY_DN10630_c0_g2_i1:1345-2598(+)